MIAGDSPVRLQSFQILSVSPVVHWAPSLIGIGLAVLVAAAWWPGAPVLTAMAVITLGASEATISRFRDRAESVTIMILHGATYTGLYILFVGAMLHAA